MLLLNDELVRRSRDAIAAMRHQSELNGNADMSLDEINFEINKQERNTPYENNQHPTRDAFWLRERKRQ